MHDFPLITTIASGFAAAWFFGLLARTLRLSPIVGYLIAGVMIGKYTPGYQADEALALQLGELGVILLMFGVGLHFHVRDLVAVKWIAIPGAIGQSLVASLCGLLIFRAMGWTASAGLMVGIAMAVASTVVLLRVLMESGRLNSPAGHAAVGWLIVEDIITVLVLVMIPVVGTPADAAAAPAGGWAWPVALALGKLAVLVAVLLVVGSRVVPWVLERVAMLRSRELFTLTVLVLSIAVATGSSVAFGASAALGAFLAGMVVGQSPVSQQAGADALPMRDAFAVLFFVSVGMMFDPAYVTREPWMVLAGLGVILIAKPLAALAIVIVLGHPARTALTVAIGLAQIGEFSFIVFELAFKHALVPPDARHLLVACAIASIAINPLLVAGLAPAESALRRSPRLWRLLNFRAERLVREGNAKAVADVAAAPGPLAIVVGYGPTGRQIDRLLREAGLATVVVDLNMEAVRGLMAEGRTAIFGDASNPELLAQAGLDRARFLVLTTPADVGRRAMISTSMLINPEIRIVMRTQYQSEADLARHFGAHAVVADEIESAVAMTEAILREVGANADTARREGDRIRADLQADGTAHA